jgi:hypothetical protein
MMNIHMLVWGAKHVGPVSDLRMDADPATTWMQMAVSHARQVAKNHIRPDGSTYHIVEYNPFEGTVNRRYTYQVEDVHQGWWVRLGLRQAAAALIGLKVGLAGSWAQFSCHKAHHHVACALPTAPTMLLDNVCC